MYESRWFSDLSLLVPVPPRYFCSFWLSSLVFFLPRVGNPSQLRAVLLRCAVPKVSGPLSPLPPCLPYPLRFFPTSIPLGKNSSGFTLKALTGRRRGRRRAQGEKDADKEATDTHKKKSRERRVSRMHWSCSLGERCSSAKGYTPT
jgi:hypothetical protein